MEHPFGLLRPGCERTMDNEYNEVAQLDAYSEQPLVDVNVIIVDCVVK